MAIRIAQSPARAVKAAQASAPAYANNGDMLPPSH